MIRTGDAARLLQDVGEQPEALARLIDTQAPVAADIARSVRRTPCHYVVMAGRGSSDNAVRYAQYLFGAERRLPVAQATPSLFTRYGAPPRLEGALVVAVSQSGESSDVVEVVAEARRQERPTIAITNTPDSSLAEAAEHVLLLQTGPERAHVATKSYVSSLAAFALLSAALDQDDELLDDVRELPDAVAATLELADEYRQAASALHDALRAEVVGRGFNYATAHEIALKLTTLTPLHALPYSAADVARVPLEVQFPPSLLIAPSGRVLSDVMDLIPTLRKRESPMAIISDDEDVLREADAPLRLPVSVREWLSPLLTVVPGQFLAIEIGQRRGVI